MIMFKITAKDENTKVPASIEEYTEFLNATINIHVRKQALVLVALAIDSSEKTKETEKAFNEYMDKFLFHRFLKLCDDVKDKNWRVEMCFDDEVVFTSDKHASGRSSTDAALNNIERALAIRGASGDVNSA